MPVFPQPTSVWHSDTYAAISPSRPELSLAGKIAVITGGGNGIGGAIARSFAAAGCTKLVLLGRREDVLLANKAQILSTHDSVDILIISADVSSEIQVLNAFTQAAAHFGTLDILVNNAAYYSGQTTIEDSTLESWYVSFDVNVKGTFLVTKAFLANAIKNATILNISSGVAHLNPPFPGFSAYAASKAAAMRFFESLQYEKPELHVVNVHPGTVATEMSARDPASVPSDTPELSADFTVWCASEEASFMKGKMAWSNWDVPELLKRKDEINQNQAFTIAIDGWPWTK